MPFTPAHVAAVLPLRGRWGLPFAALAAGSMSPDLPYFLPFSLPRLATHTPLGIITWDLLFGLGMWTVWRLAAPGLHDMAPTLIRSRWRLVGASHSTWWAVVLAVILGSATHVVWDSFTHAGYPGAALGPLATTYPSPIGPFPGYRYLQYTSGVVGLVILGAMGWRLPSSTPALREQPCMAALAPSIMLASALVFVAIRTTGMDDPSDRRALVFAAVTSSISGVCLALVMLCVVHTLRARVTKYRPSAG